MVKKFYILLIAIVLSQNAIAQFNNDEFRTYSYKILNNVYHYFNDNDYSKAYQLIISWQTQYNILPETAKLSLITFAQDSDYDLAKYYALTGYPNHAIHQLKLAVEKGYRNYYKLKGDANFNLLYEYPDFVELLKDLQQKGDNLYILRNSSAYASQQSNAANFTYQSSYAGALQNLRKHYNLDSIAGNANEETQIINLMRWVHHTVRHDGFKISPDEKNALNFLQQAKKSPLNCHAIAILLNDVYLAMDLPARYVTCYPKDSTDWEYHVINAVYSKSNNKWLFMDPTNAAYVMDANGQLLSISEVRSHLINNKVLILNPDANWNQTYTRTTTEYLWNYMAKNLYWFECPLNSEFDYETQKPQTVQTYIRLYPQGYYNSNYLKKETIYTNNEADFWSAPKRLLSDNGN